MNYLLRALCISFVVAGAFLLPVSYAVASYDIADGLVSHWKLEETSGDRDDEISGHTLTDHNSVSTTTGKIGNAASFNSEDSQYLSVADNTDLSTGGGKSFSIGVWVKLSSKLVTQVFVGKYQNSSTGEYAIYYEPSNDRFVFSTYGNGDTYAAVADSLGSPAVDTWYYIVAVHDATADNVSNRIVVNGRYANTARAVEHADSSADFVIGAFTSGSYFTDGFIDEVSFWNRRLNMFEVASLYNNGDGISYPFSEATSLAGGTGTVEDPYRITTCEALQDMRDDLNGHYKLINDIDCAASESWNANPLEWVDGVIDGELIPDSYGDVTHTDVIVNNNGYFGFSPVGDNTTPFMGELDGDGHSITNLWIFRKDSVFVGILGNTVNGNIHDITLSNSDIVGSNYTGGIAGYADAAILSDITLEDNMVRVYLAMYGGGLAGYMNGDSTVTHIRNNGGNVHGSGIIVGGLVGEANSGEFTDLDSSADVDGGYEVGGMFGAIVGGSTLTDVHATGNVTADYSEYIVMKTGYYAGGFAGYISDGVEITNASASSTVSSKTRYSGGFAGYIAYNTEIYNASSTGSVTAFEEVVNESLMDVFSVGGFVGNSFLSHFYNVHTDVHVDSDGDAVGGFVGSASCESTFTQSYATGNVTGYDRVGGFAGEDGCEGPGSTFTESFSTGNVEGNDYVGGFIGNASVSTLLNTYSLGTVYGNNYVGGLLGASNSGTTSKSYAAGEVTGIGENNIGGFIGSNGDTNIEYSFWDLVAVDQSESCGNGACAGVSGTSTLAMKSQATFRDVSWDFGDIWGMNTEDNNGYPFFLYQNFTPDEYTPPETTPRKHKRSSSVRSQVKHLEDNGNNTGAADLKAQFPQVFAPTLGGGQAKTTFTKNLQLGMTDTEVTTLQHFLIEYKAGPAAAALGAHGVTGYFGPLTQAALIEFQKAKGITPAIGFFGPITRGVAHSI